MNRFNIEDKKVVASIDLGATSIKYIIGTISSDGLNIEGAVCIPHNGLYKGRIINMKETAEALREGIKETEIIAGLSISQLFVGISGNFNIFSSHGMSIIPSHQVTNEDLNKAIETAKAVALPTGHRLLHVLPKSFTVDKEGPFFNPLGLSGLRLETSVMIVSIPETTIQNTIQCLRYAGCYAKGLVLQPFATYLSLLSENEKKIGVCVVDIGQDQTYFTIIINSRVHYIGVLSMGGEDFTHDLMSELKITQDLAENLKIKYGNICTKQNLENKNITLDKSQNMGTNINLQKVNSILTARTELLFEEIKTQLKSLGYFDLLEAGLVLTGGGSSLKGLVEIGRLITQKPVKKSVIKNFSGNSEIKNKNNFSTALGILHYIENEHHLDYRSNYNNKKVLKIKRWMQDIFM